MLKTILRKLNGHAVEAPSLAAALTELEQARAATQGEIEVLNQKRQQALLDDATDEALDKIERSLDRATVRLEKINVAEGPLRDQLAMANTAERARRWGTHLAAYRAAAAEFLSAARNVAERHADVIAAMNAARREGFEREIAANMPATPNVGGKALCSPDLLNAFERALSPASRAPGTAPVVGVRHYVGRDGYNAFGTSPAAPPKPPTPSLQHGISIDPLTAREFSSSAGRVRAPKLPNDDAPLGADEARVVVLRGGFEAPDGQSQVGRRVRLKKDAALQAARSGVVDIIEGAP